MEIAKALVLAGGSPGDTPWPSVEPTPKALVPVANRPILFHNLDMLRRSGVLEAAIAVTYGAAPAIRQAIGDGSDWGLDISFAEYAPQDGLDAVLGMTRDFLGDEPVLVQEGDALLRQRINHHIATFATERLDAVVLRLPATGADPEQAAGGWMLSTRGVRMLQDRRHAQQDPVAYIRQHGGGVGAVDVEGCLFRHGGQAALLEGNRRMLDELRADHQAPSLPGCELQGPVVVHPDAHLERTLVRGPAIIGPGARLTDAYVGPYTSIGPDVTIEGAEIEYSIVLAGAELRFIGARIESSVIGEGARVGRAFSIPTAMRLSVGAGAEIQLP